MKIRVKKLTSEAIVPSYQTKGAAGFDLHSVEELTLEPGKRAMVATGLAFSIDEGYEVQVRPRSGLAYKYGVSVINTPGTIDSDYRGEIKVLLINHGEEPFAIKKGERIAQAVVKEVVLADFTEVEELDDTERGSGGFGSTGR